MKKLKILHKTDINGGPVSGQHVKLLHQKTTADDDDDDDSQAVFLLSVSVQ